MEQQSKVVPLQNTTISESVKQTYYSMNVPPLYHGKTLKNFIGFEDQVEKSIAAILNKKSLFITGTVGTGKTHLAIAITMEWGKEFVKGGTVQYGERRYPIFVSSAEFFLELKDTFGGNGSEKDILDRYSRTPLLCIDDIGAEKISDWSRQMFYTLIDRRYRDEKQTIITSNLTLEDVSKLIDDRISSRIVGMGVVVNLTGEDYRLKS